MKIPAIAIAAFLATTPVIAQSLGEKTGVNSALGIAPKTADFVSQAAISDMFEIESSKLALERADVRTKAFATQMIADHEKTTAQLKGLISSGKVTEAAPAAMDDAHKAKLDKLKGLNGDDFTKQYRADQVTAHEDAVSLFQRYGKGGENSALKDWAAKTAPALEHHLDMAKKLAD